MAKYAFERIPAFDNSFLLMETPNAYMHVASTHIFESGPLRKPDGGIDADAIKSAIEAGLHMIPRYCQKLAYLTSEHRPVWVDDDRFDIDYHIRHTSLPRPGNEEQLKRQSVRIMQQHLDRDRPLWEIWVIEGLEGDRFALVPKVHHCMIDGIAGVDLMMVLMSMTPEHFVPEGPPFRPRPAPSRMDVLYDDFVQRVSKPIRAARTVKDLINHPQDLRREVSLRTRALGQTLASALRYRSSTPLNHKIGPNRRFDWLTMPLTEIKAVRHALKGSVNDVVLTIVTGAVRAFLKRRRVEPHTINFRVLTPVSVRTRAERGTLGNRISAWIVDLPIGEKDPRVQIEHIREQTAALKESRQALGAEMLTQMAEWTSTTLMTMGARNISRVLPFNMVVTNVPGPQFPMYMLGAKMLDAFPHVALINNLGLGVALLSYNGKLCWGFNCDYDLVPDISSFVEAIQESFDTIRKIAGLGASAADDVPSPSRHQSRASKQKKRSTKKRKPTGKKHKRAAPAA